MAANECAMCGAPKADDHHVTGRGPNRQYLDPELTVPLCHLHHELAHDDLRSQRLDVPARDNSWDGVAQVEFCLARTAVFLGRLGETTGIAVLLTLADAFRRWSDILAAHRAAFRKAGVA